jgi:hypothetical protein
MSVILQLVMPLGWTCSFYNTAAACAVPRHGQVCSTAVYDLYAKLLDEETKQLDDYEYVF